MSVKANGFRLARHKSASRRLLACGAVCNAAMLCFAAATHAATPNTWISSTSGNWSDGTKWMGGTPPTVDPNGDVNLDFNATGSYTANNDLGAFPVYNTTFDTDNGTTHLTGGDINLSWPLSEVNNPTFTNNSTNPVTIDNNVNFTAPAGVGGTVEYFSMVPGSTTTINGTVHLTGGSGFKMVNGTSTGTGGPGGTLIWTQPVVWTNTPTTQYGNYFPFRIYEGTLEMGGYTINNGISNNPVINVSGVNVLQTTGLDGKITAGPNMGATGAPNNGAVTDMYLGPEDVEMGHPDDVVAFYLIANGNSMNQPVQIGDAKSTTIGGVNTSGTVTFNDFFKTLPTDGNGTINGVSQIISYSAAAGGTVLQNFQLIRGGGSGFCGASVDKVGAGTWIVAGGGDNDQGEQAYHGNTTVSDGTLELAYDDTGVNSVTLPAAALNAGAPYYGSGFDGGSLGFNDPSNAVQLGTANTLATDNIALLTLNNPGLAGPRQVLHDIIVNNNNPNGTTSIGVADNGTGNFLGNISLLKNVVLTSGTGGLANFSGNISGAFAVNIAGTGVVALSGSNTYGGATTVASGASLNVISSLPATTLNANGNVTFVANAGTGIKIHNIPTINLTSTGKVSVAAPSAPANRTLLVTSALNFAGSAPTFQGLLDLGANDMIIHGGNLTTTRQELKQGLAGSAGITSSAATASSSPKTALGYASIAGTFDGQAVTASDVILKYTLVGDTDLNGSVAFTDLLTLAQHYQGTSTTWTTGDFNYDGSTNFTDLLGLAQNYTKVLPTLNASQVSQLDAAGGANFAAAFAQAQAQAAVPEPVILSLLGIAAVGSLSRKRRRA